MIENENGIQIRRALLVGANLNDGDDFEASMKELGSLAEACQMEVVCMITQNLSEINRGLYIGTGKVEEIEETIGQVDADVVVFDNALSPVQLKNLQHEISVPVLDRTTLILDIFASRAQTKEAKLQVESARLQYMLPRLIGLRASLSRQGGASGSLSNKGSGEKQIDLDRRKIEKRISELRKELETVARDRETQRKQRAASGIPRVALVGYTNAGKSTLMNVLVDEYIGDDAKKVMEKDMLFATLETTVRKIVPENRKAFLISDTVGFIHKLPHHLIKAFRSTLEEVKEADVLLQVVDVSDENYKEHIKVTNETLLELGAAAIPCIYVFNKADKKEMAIPMMNDDRIYMSAKHKIGLTELVALIQKTAFADCVDCEMLIPYEHGNIVSYFLQNAEVKQTEYEEMGTHLVLNCKKSDYNKYNQYVI